MARLLARPVRPTAILASNDLTAIGAMNAIFEVGAERPGRHLGDRLRRYRSQHLSLEPPLTTDARLTPRDRPHRLSRPLQIQSTMPAPQGAEFTIHPTLIERKSTGRVVPQAARSAETGGKAARRASTSNVGKRTGGTARCAKPGLYSIR